MTSKAAVTTPGLIVVVGEDQERVDALVTALRDAGLEVRSASSPDKLVRSKRSPAVILLCATEAGGALRTQLRTLRKGKSTAVAAIMVMGNARRNRGLLNALFWGADDFVPNDATRSELRARIAARLSSRGVVRDLTRQRRAAEMVLELTQALGSKLHIRDILFLVVQRIAEVVQFDRVSIVLSGLSDETGVVLVASDDQKLSDLPIRLEDYPEIGTVLDTGEPLLIPDAAKHPLFEVDHADVPARFRSLTLFPIHFEGRPMGVLFLRNQEPRPLEDSEVTLLRAVANATSVAIRNAKLLESLRDESRRFRSAQFEAEQRVRTLQRYAAFFDASADGIVVVDARGKVLFCNPAACRITQRTPDELRRGLLDTMLATEDTKRFNELKDSFARGDFTGNIDLSIQTPAGEMRVVNVSFNSLLSEEGTIIISFRDVTDERNLARELTHTKEWLQRVIDSSVDAIVSAGIDGTVQLFNPAAERTVGYRAADIVGELNVTALYPEGVAREVMRRIRSPEHGDTGRLEGYRTELMGKSGQRIPVSLSAALIMHSGEPIGSVGVFRDLRANLKMEARLAEAQQELAVQEKKSFIAELAGATAHELNQPLTAVMGYADLLARRVDEQSPLSDASAAIVRETERMADIVKKIGKLTKYETKTYVGEAKIIDIDRSTDSDPSGLVG